MLTPAGNRHCRRLVLLFARKRPFKLTFVVPELKISTQGLLRPKRSVGPSTFVIAISLSQSGGNGGRARRMEMGAPGVNWEPAEPVLSARSTEVVTPLPDNLTTNLPPFGFSKYQ